MDSESKAGMLKSDRPLSTSQCPPFGNVFVLCLRGLENIQEGNRLLNPPAEAPRTFSDPVSLRRLMCADRELPHHAGEIY